MVHTEVTTWSGKIELSDGDVKIYLIVSNDRIWIEHKYGDREFLFDVPSVAMDKERIEKWTKVSKLITKATAIIKEIQEDGLVYLSKLSTK